MTKEIEQFIKRKLKQGLKLDAIVKTMLDQGMPEHDVRLALVEIHDDNRSEHKVIMDILKVKTPMILIGFFLLIFLVTILAGVFASGELSFWVSVVAGAIYGLYAVLALSFAGAMVYFALKFLDSKNRNNTFGNALLSQVALMVLGGVVALVAVFSVSTENVFSVFLIVFILDFIFGLMIYSIVYAMPLMKSFALMSILAIMYWILGMVISMSASMLFRLVMMKHMTTAAMSTVPILAPVFIG